MTKLVKVLCVIVALVMVLSVAACGKQTTDEPTTTPQSTVNSDANSGESGDTDVAAEPIVLRYANVYTADSHYGKAIAKFKEIVEANSNGELEIEVYNDGVLGSEGEMIQSQKDGGVEIACSASSGIGLYVDAYQMFESWYAYENVEDVRTLFESMMDTLDPVVQEAGFKLIGAFYDGYRCFVTKDKEIKSIADLQGLKMRCPANATFPDYFEALGIQAVSMPMSDVYTALQNGSIDGCDGFLDSVYTQKYYEQAKYLIWDCHTFSPMAVTFNLDAWNALSPEHQQIILDAAKEATDYQVELFEGQIDKELQEMKDAGLQVLEVPDRDQWIAAVADVRAKHAESFGDLGVQIMESQDALH